MTEISYSKGMEAQANPFPVLPNYRLNPFEDGNSRLIRCTFPVLIFPEYALLVLRGSLDL